MVANVKSLSVFAGMALVFGSVFAFASSIVPIGGDEFVGPFPSWSNLQRDFGAKGDGVTDDTEAIQNSLNAVGAAGRSPVLYIPGGTYLVTRPLSLRGGINLSVVGEDPETTTLKWAGSEKGTLFQIDAVAYSRFVRLTFDGGRTATTAMSQSESPASPASSRQLYFATGNEFSDDVFENAEYGLRVGYNTSGDAEGSILRCKFVNNTSAGFETENPNALDWWIWDSTFFRNAIGAANTSGAYHVYNSLFEQSTYEDVFIFNTGNFNYRGNTSINSAAFMNTAYYYTNAAPTIIEGNFIFAPTAAKGYAIWQGLMGALTLIDNVFTTRDGLPPCSGDGVGCAVSEGAQYGADVFDIGNTYTTPKAVILSYGKSNSGDPYQLSDATQGPVSPFILNRLINQDNRIVSASAVEPTRPAMPGTLRNYHRRVIEVSPGSADVEIQRSVDKAGLYCGSKPVVHMPYGNYPIAKPLVVPPDCDIQIVGDGGTTLLTWKGPKGGSVIDLKGPSRATIRELSIDGAYGSATGILVENADQVDSRVYLLEATLNGSTRANLFVDGLDNTFVESQDIEHAEATVASVIVRGGPNAEAGHPLKGKTVLFGGSGGANTVSFDVSRGGNLMVQDTWYEGPNPSKLATVSDIPTSRSYFTIEGSRGALPKSNGPEISISSLNGNVTVLNNTLFNVVKIGGSGSGHVWVAGNTTDGTGAFPPLYESSSYLINNSPTIRGVFTLNRFQGKNGSRPLPDQGAADPEFVRVMLAQDRVSRFSTVVDLEKGITDVKLYRVTTTKGGFGVHIRAD